MFSLEVDRRRLRVRLGRWHFRTYRSYFTKLSNGHRAPLDVYAVEERDQEERQHVQVGVFLELSDAETLRDRLESKGQNDVRINFLTVHGRLEDWEWDR